VGSRFEGTMNNENDHPSLPQPRRDHDNAYNYVLYEDLAENFFPSRLEPGALCWVLKSKGLQSKQDDERCSQRSELFLRARVVRDDQEGDLVPTRRILVRYPRGSTYHVKRSNLIPVLEPPSCKCLPVVLIMAETPDYRRAAVVHTCLGDSFLEIGCDYGACVNRVQRALHDIRSVPRNPQDEPMNLPPADVGRVWCLGVDKSTESIDIATKQFPSCKFSVEDALTSEGIAKLQILCASVLQTRHPSVVAIDINGNREIPAVLQCVDNILNPGSDEWGLPRLILVKSRLLHSALRSSARNVNVTN
jgi:hypothetical protein